jgi:hypothetical protein
MTQRHHETMLALELLAVALQCTSTARDCMRKAQHGYQVHLSEETDRQICAVNTELFSRMCDLREVLESQLDTSPQEGT